MRGQISVRIQEGETVGWFELFVKNGKRHVGGGWEIDGMILLWECTSSSTADGMRHYRLQGLPSAYPFAYSSSMGVPDYIIHGKRGVEPTVETRYHREVAHPVPLCRFARHVYFELPCAENDGETSHVIDGGFCMCCGIAQPCVLCNDALSSTACDTCEDGLRLCEECVSRCHVCGSRRCLVCVREGRECACDSP